MADQYDDVRIILSLERLGELIAFVAQRLTELRSLEPPDFDGEEMRDLSISGFRYCVHMGDRTQFEASVLADLDQLDAIPVAEGPQHRPEFGL